MEYIMQNWEVIGLLITNLIAIFTKSPLKSRR